MPQTFELFRTTGSFRVAYDHLNEHEQLGEAKALGKRNEGGSSDGTGEWFTQRVIVGKWFDPSNETMVKEVTRSLARLYRVECRCEHDCCGHFNGGASVAHKKGREFIAWARYDMNI